MAHMPRVPEPEVMDDDLEAEAYAVADFADVNQAFVERLLELSGTREEVHAVDLGAGPADIPIRIMRERPYWHIVAVEAAEAMAGIARKAVADARLSEGIEILVADAKSVPVPSSSFDVVFSNSILHHVTDTEGFWTELQRLALPGGLVLLRDLARPQNEGRARQIVEQYSGQESDLLKEEFLRSLLSAYTPDEVAAQLAQAGLECLQISMSSDRHLDVFGRLP